MPPHFRTTAEPFAMDPTVGEAKGTTVRYQLTASDVGKRFPGVGSFRHMSSGSATSSTGPFWH